MDKTPDTEDSAVLQIAKAIVADGRGGFELRDGILYRQGTACEMTVEILTYIRDRLGWPGD